MKVGTSGGGHADFMFEIGSIKQKANSWKDVFFDEIHGAEGT
jgi:hypothetical protein